jgi:transposase InsO family protein
MPWKECDMAVLRMELVRLMSAENANVAALCRRFGVSRKTAYKWLRRYKPGDPAVLTDQSRRPQSSPRRTADDAEAKVLAVRDEHPAWGPRKIGRVLQRRGIAPPACSTIGSILLRHDRISPESSAAHQPLTRFERSSPNELWQMDFKGDFALTDQRRCHPLTVLDDHSRFSLCLRACLNQQRQTVESALTQTFRRYGLPIAMLMDNGSPWAVSHVRWGHTALTVWLLKLDVKVLHGRPYHPQTQGKEERFHRTLKAEVLAGKSYQDVEAAQADFERWRDVYNQERPHEALGLEVPASRYQMSMRPFPECLPAMEYGPGDAVRKVNRVGQLSYGGRTYKISQAFGGERVGVRPTTREGVMEVYFGRHRIGELDEREATSRSLEA